MNNAQYATLKVGNVVNVKSGKVTKQVTIAKMNNTYIIGSDNIAYNCASIISKVL